MKIATIVGARPQFIKAAVVSRAIRDRAGIEEILIHTGQHFDANMSDVFFDELDIRRPDYQLGIGGGTHGQNTGRMIEAIEEVLMEVRPDKVLVYGDTDSTLAAALAAVKLHMPIAHVEAGLRSFNRRMPEEINRVLTDHVAELLFAPTQTAVKNLAAEGIRGEQVCMVGDVMYDASLYYRKRAKQPAIDGCPDSGFVLCTIHRAENTDDAERLDEIIRALKEIAHDEPVILPIHPRTVKAIGADNCGKLHPNICVIDPVGFLEMNWLLNHCSLVMTDSGGLQKEAYFYGKPCVTLREETEWLELLEVGVNCLAPPGEADILTIFHSMQDVPIDDKQLLYGDGNAGEKIVERLIQ
jgi:UDP-GlcNAc3NAcA epimerase